MSLVRAFTQRAKRQSSSDMPSSAPSRSLTVHKPGKPLDRSLISSPTLLSTTNVHFRNAVDIPSIRNVSNSTFGSATSPRSSSDESDNSMMSDGSRGTLTDASSVGSSPTSPKPNALSGYFKSNQVPRHSQSTSNIQRTSTRSSKSSTPSLVSKSSTPSFGSKPSTASFGSKYSRPSLEEASPAIPPRANSHSKQAHEQLARQRSTHQINGRPAQPAPIPRSVPVQNGPAVREQRSSFDMFRSDEPAHPFGRELEKLTEVAEEFGNVIRSAETQEDMEYMRKKGLAKFSLDDYLVEIQPFYYGVVQTKLQPKQANRRAVWI